jgi:glucose-6-phosphate 1-epimerase
MTVLFAAIVALTNMYGSVGVDTHGARVVSYVPAGGGEVFFNSATGTGGMPLCWPWFAGNGPYADSRRHGIARYMDFEVVRKECSRNASTLVLRLKSGDATRRLFPHDFELEVVVKMDRRLTVEMTGRNTGKTPFPVTEAFHPYFAVSDSRKCAVDASCTRCYSLGDPASGRMLRFSGSGDKGLYVWRPNPESHLSKSVSPIGPDDWRRFVCVENGTLKKEDAYVLAPGESHTLSRTISAWE